MGILKCAIDVDSAVAATWLSGKKLSSNHWHQKQKSRETNLQHEQSTTFLYSVTYFLRKNIATKASIPLHEVKVYKKRRRSSTPALN
jgi:hypothetical protein